METRPERLHDARKTHLLPIPPVEGQRLKLTFRGRAGRNEPCPCRSGKKYKRCCLVNR